MDRFSNKQPGESYYVEFDFTNYVGTTTVTSAVVSAKIVSTGVDVTATLTTVGKQLITSPSVYVWVTDGTANIDYQITCVATCNDGSIYEMEGLLLVADVPATALAASTGPGCVVAPILEPVSLEQLRKNARIDGHDDDEELTEMLKDARMYVENNITNRALLTQTWDYCLDAWPDKNYITLPKGNLQSVTSVKWKNTTGTEATLVVSTDYFVETNGDQLGRIVLPDGVSWPSSTLYPSNPITIRYICGWTSASLIPGQIKRAILMIATDFYENRELYICTGQPLMVNQAVDSLLWSWRLWPQS